MRLIDATAVTLAMALAGCASGGTTTGEPQAEPESSGVESYSREVGLATMDDLRRITTRILERYQFEVERFDEGAYTFIDTRWKDRPVFEDERLRGITAARTRILIRTRLRSRVTDEILAVHRVTLNAENMVMTEGNPDWVFGIMTDEFRDYASRIATQFQTEFRAGIRREE